MIRSTAAVLAGLLAWIVVATLLNLAMRVTWPDYAAAEISKAFTLAMLGARLVIGAVSTVCAGFVSAWVARRAGMPAAVLGMLLLLCFIPVHYTLWNVFPLWYHAAFLISLIPLSLLGARWRMGMGMGMATPTRPS